MIPFVNMNIELANICLFKSSSRNRYYMYFNECILATGYANANIDLCFLMTYMCLYYKSLFWMWTWLPSTVYDSLENKKDMDISLIPSNIILFTCNRYLLLDNTSRDALPSTVLYLFIKITYRVDPSGYRELLAGHILK